MQVRIIDILKLSCDSFKYIRFNRLAAIKLTLRSNADRHFSIIVAGARFQALCKSVPPCVAPEFRPADCKPR
jgi:hypothetical protein